jgi:hypothetical protein
MQKCNQNADRVFNNFSLIAISYYVLLYYDEAVYSVQDFSMLNNYK